MANPLPLQLPPPGSNDGILPARHRTFQGLYGDPDSDPYHGAYERIMARLWDRELFLKPICAAWLMQLKSEYIASIYRPSL
jgi:hypothetical protein